jgi:hypothetical protein
MLLYKCLNSINEDYRRLIDNTKGIIFFGTPHKISSLADFLKYVPITSKSINSLDSEENRKELEDLSKEFGRVYGRSLIKTLSLAENVPFYKKVIVPEDSAHEENLPNNQVIAMDLNHNTICKPESTKDEVYIVVKNWINTNYSG